MYCCTYSGAVLEPQPCGISVVGSWCPSPYDPSITQPASTASGVRRKYALFVWPCFLVLCQGMIPRMEDYMATRQYHAWQCEFIAKLTKSTPVLKCTCIHGLEQQQHSWRVAFDFQLFVYVTATMALGASCLCSWEEYPHWGHYFCKVSQCWTWIVRWPHVIFCDSHVTSCDLLW